MLIPAAAVLVCAATEIYALADRSSGEPRNRDIRRYVLGEVSEGSLVEERIVPKSDGLSSVTIYPRPAAPAPTGNVLIELYDVTDGGQPQAVRQVSAPTVELARMPSFTMHFQPQQSTYREYVLQVSVSGGSDGQGIGLLATRRGDVHDHPFESSMFINGRRQFGNLAFKTTVDGATSNFGSIASQLAHRGVPAARVALALVLLLKSAALWFIIRAVAAGPIVPPMPSQTTRG